ncbi:MAG: YegP family protein [Actinomycetota bacterium]|nr:YegP family protein [Actinomycetota bacterium]
MKESGLHMSGNFEVFSEGNGGEFSFRLTADDGTVIAVSPKFAHLKGVIAGINAVRENAATGFIVDHTHGAIAHP